MDYCYGDPCNEAQAHGKCINHDSNYTCECLAGVWGGVNCTDDIEDNCENKPCVWGTCTDAVRDYNCSCDVGATGKNCSTDIQDCFDDTCANGGLCQDKVGGFSCTCLTGWKGFNCTEDIDECLNSTTHTCDSNTQYCNNTAGSYECLCKTGYQLKDGICDEIILWPFTATLIEQLEFPTDLNFKFPYFDRTFTSLEVHKNGFLTFGERYSQPLAHIAKAEWPNSPSIFNVFGADFNFVGDSSSNGLRIEQFLWPHNFSVDYPGEDVFNQLDSVSELSSTGFKATWVMVATWLEAAPMSPDSHYTDRASFQCILATDGRVSYAVLNYDSVWQDLMYAGRPQVSLSYSGEGGIYTELPMPENKKTQVVKLFSGTPTNDNTGRQCLTKIDEAKQANVTEAINALPACPCLKAQIAVDSSFTAIAGSCFTSNSSVGNYKQKCCYDSHNILLTNSNNKNHLWATSGGNSDPLIAAFDTCCPSPSGLCDTFYTHFPNSNCSHYVVPSGVVKTPQFADRWTPITVTPTSPPLTLALERALNPNDTLTFSVEGGSSIFGSLVNDSLFEWKDSLNDLRAEKYPQTLSFLAKIENPSTNTDVEARFSPVVHLCLCQESQQCKAGVAMDYMGQTGNVAVLACDCGSSGAGLYCEKPYDQCLNCLNDTVCVSNSTETQYCGACPPGFKGTDEHNSVCQDIDECQTSPSPCSQLCTNTQGSYTCSCRPGYTQDGPNCIDIDECQTNNTCTADKPNSYCVNTPGDFRCQCLPRYVESINECIKAKNTFNSQISFAGVDDQKWTDDLNNASSPAFEKLAYKVETVVRTSIADSNKITGKFTVDVYAFMKSSTRRKRSVDNSAQVTAQYTVSTEDATVTPTIVENALEQGFGDSRICPSTCNYGGPQGLLGVPRSSLLTNSDLCSVASLNKCQDFTTSGCYTMNNQVHCNCSRGFSASSLDPFACEDIDECAASTSCQGCVNTMGGYICSCREGQVWSSAALQCVASPCSPNPCMHGGECLVTGAGFACKCSAEWSGSTCANVDEDYDKLETTVLIVGIVLGVCCFVLLIFLVVMCCKRRKTLESDTYSSKRYGEYGGGAEYSGLPRPKVTVAGSRSDGNVYGREPSMRSQDMAENGRGGMYSEISGDRSSMVPKGSQGGPGAGFPQVYSNQAYDESEAMEHL